MVSAVKVGGRRLHALARAGIEVERAARPVTVYRFDVGPGPSAGVFRIEVECSSGTYVRVLAADLGAAARRGSPSPEPATHPDRLVLHRGRPAGRRADPGGGAHPGPGAPGPRPGGGARRASGRWWPAAWPSTGCRWGSPATDPGAWSIRATGCWPCTRPPRPTGSGPPWCSRRPDEARWPAPRAGRPAPFTVVTAVTFHGDGDRDRLVDLHAPARGQRGDHRRLRRCPPRPPGPARRAAGPGPGRRALHHRGHLRPPPGHRGAPRVGAQAPLRPRPEARAAGIGGGRADGGRPLRRGAGQRDGRGLRARSSWSTGSTPGWWWWGRTSTSATAARATWPCCGRWDRRPGSPSRGSRSGPTVTPPARRPEPISSTRIRSLVGAGRVEEAAVLLGRPHQVRGEVVHGDHRGGAELGFPTANVAVPDGICLPAAGIYAGWYERPDGSTREGGRVGRPAPDLLRGRGRPAGRGLRARLRRRSLRRGGQGVLRVPPARGAGLRARRGAHRTDGTGRGRHPGAAGEPR